MIEATIKKGKLVFVGVHEYEKNAEKKSVITYIVRDVETEKSYGSLVCTQFVDGHKPSTLKNGSYVKVSVTMRENLKKNDDGTFAKDDKGHYISTGFDFYVNSIENIDAPETATKEQQASKEPLQPLPFELTEEQKKGLTSEQKAALGIK
jgi:hypothetical protein